MVSFDVVSLFTRVPIRETMGLLSRHFVEDILTLFRHVLTSSYFSFASQFYEQIDGVTMGSPISPVIANFYVEDSEEMALNRTPHKPLCWFPYVDIYQPLPEVQLSSPPIQQGGRTLHTGTQSQSSVRPRQPPCGVGVPE
jgi:hypothetical protein